MAGALRHAAISRLTGKIAVDKMIRPLAAGFSPFKW
jgi:hypothetical protein